MQYAKRSLAAEVAWLLTMALSIWSCVKYGQFRHSKQDQYISRTSGHNIGFDGDDDFYGLGIRLGVYLQWLASFVATVFLDLEQQRLTAAYIGAQTAMLAAFLALMFRDACVFTAESIVVVYFLLGGISSVLGPDLVAGLIGGRFAQKIGLLDFIVMFLICLVTTIASWFWIRIALVGDGVDFMSTPGGTSIFLFLHVHNNGLKAAGVYMAIICLFVAACTLDKAFGLIITKMHQKDLVWEPPSIALASSVILTVIITHKLGCFNPSSLFPRSLLDWACSSFPWDKHLLGWFRKDIERINDQWKPSPNVQRQENLLSTDSKPASRRFHDAPPDLVRYQYGVIVKLTSIALSFISMSLSIIAIELTLGWNHIFGIYTITSAGQIIPLTVGLILVLTVLWRTWERVLNPNGRRGRGRDRDARIPSTNDAKGDPLSMLKRLLNAAAQPQKRFTQRGPRCDVEFAPLALQGHPEMASIGFQGTDGKWL